MIADHDAYIAEAPKDLRPLLDRLRAQLARALPDAEEVIAYNMPGFRIGQSIVAGYAAFSKQCGLYLAPAAIKSHAGDIAAAGLKFTKTGVTFLPSQPIPEGLVRKLALASRKDQNLMTAGRNASASSPKAKRTKKKSAAKKSVKRGRRGDKKGMTPPRGFERRRRGVSHRCVVVNVKPA